MLATCYSFLTLMVLSLRPLTIFSSSYCKQYTPLELSLWHRILSNRWCPHLQLFSMFCGWEHEEYFNLVTDQIWPVVCISPLLQPLVIYWFPDTVHRSPCMNLVNLFYVTIILFYFVCHDSNTVCPSTVLNRLFLIGRHQFSIIFMSWQAINTKCK